MVEGDPDHEATDEAALEKALQKHADKLLQTDRRSPLIQFERPTGTRIWLADFPSLDWLEDALPDAEGGAQGLRIASRPMPADGAPPVAVSRDPIGGARPTGSVIADADKRELAAAALKLAKAGRTYAQETGLEVLRLVTGFLEWREPGATAGAAALWSPLLSTPIRLSGETIARLDEPEDNATLRRKLYHEWRLALPEVAEDEGADAYLDRVAAWAQDAAATLPGAAVRRRAAIGALSFAAHRMHKDLLHPSIKRSRLVRRILVGPHRVFDPPEPLRFDDMVLEARGKPDPLPPLVFDADGSQHAALVEALQNRRSLVIEGPPGTGKSQTICNLIAAALADGRRVLFVSQKQAALDVVRRRLEDVGLGGFCLDLHGVGMTKAGFLDRVAKRLKRAPPAPPKTDARGDRDDAWRALALPARALAAPVGEDQASGYEAIWRFEAARARLGPLALAAPAIESPRRQISATQLDGTFKQLAAAMDAMAGIDAGALDGLTLKPESTRAFVGTYLETLQDAAVRLRDAAHYAAGWVATPPDKAKITPHQAAQVQDRLGAFPDVPPQTSLALCRVLALGDQPTLAQDLEAVVRGLEGDPSWADQPAEEIARVAGFVRSGRRTPAEAEQAHAALTALERALRSIQESTGVGLTTVGHARGAVVKLRQPAQLIGDRVPEWLAGLDVSLLAEAARDATAVERHQTEAAALRGVLSADAAGLPAERAEKAAQALAASNALNFGPDRPVASLPPPMNRKVGAYAASEATAVGAVVDGLRRRGALGRNEETLRARPLIARLLSCGVDFANDLGAELRKAAEIGKLSSSLVRIAARPAGDGPTMLAGLADRLDRALRAADELGLLSGQGAATLPRPADAGIGPAQSFAKELRQIGVDPSLSRDARKARVAEIAALAAARDRLRAAGWCDQDPGLGDWVGWLDRARAAQAVSGRVAELSPPLRARLVGLLNEPDGARRWAELPSLRDELRDALAAFDAARQDVDACFAWGTQGVAPASRPLDEVARHLDAVRSSPALDAWLKLQMAIAVLRDAGRGPLLRLLETKRAAPSQLSDLDRVARWRPVAASVLRDPALASFTGSDAETLRGAFAKADTAARKETAVRIAAQLAQAKPAVGAGGQKLSQMTDRVLLETLIKAKRPRMPIRTIMLKARQALTDLFPCFMMGPLAVAQYVEPDGKPFDLLIIDEASQLPVHEGLGALARAEQVVVVGDPHQMPPSNLFHHLDDGVLDEDDGDGDGGSLDPESILGAAQARYPTRRLLWHYRSRHEGLIRFSNERVYDGELLVFASAAGDGPERGVRLINVREPRYVNQQNLPEALTVAELSARVMSLELTKEPAQRRTLAVIAINAKQADLIEDTLRNSIYDFPSFIDYERWAEEVRREPFVVKNLENAQGDERDIIILSLTYGPNPDGKIIQNFGPISREGGYRRLNVLVSRARDQMLVVSSLRPEHISEQRSAKDAPSERPGKVLLRRFLNHAADGGGYGGASVVTRGPESGFEEAVGAALDQAGIPFDWQVGSAGARIDIAIRHPARSGAYVLAVECDGDVWHRAASRREADRLRQERLEAMGWRFHRIWSSDWSADPQRSRDALIAACRRAIDDASCDAPQATEPAVLQGLADAVARRRAGEGRSIEGSDWAAAPAASETSVEATAVDAAGVDAAGVDAAGVDEAGVEEGGVEVDGPEEATDGPILRSAVEGAEILLYEDDDPSKARRMKLVRGRNDLDAGLLGLHTPLGRQLEDRAEGTLFTVTLPKGKVTYRLAEVILPN